MVLKKRVKVVAYSLFLSVVTCTVVGVLGISLGILLGELLSRLMFN